MTSLTDVGFKSSHFRNINKAGFWKQFRYTTVVKMEKINSEIEEMYSELTLASDDADTKQKSFDFSFIRDSFRQHINNRRNTDSSDVVLLDDQTIQNIQALKREIFGVLQNFKSLNSIKKQSPSTVKTFSNFEEFVSFAVNQEEILSSELWKIEAIYNYLECNTNLNP